MDLFYDNLMALFRVLFIFGLTLLTVGCSPNTFYEYEMEGQSIVKDLVLDLQGVRNAQDLEKIRGSIEKKMELLVDIMIEVSSKEKSLIATSGNKTNDYFASDILKYELVRLMNINGCREIIENAQREPLYRLAKYCDSKKLSK